MRKFIKSVVSFSMALPLFGVKQVVNLLSVKDETKANLASSMDKVTQATEDGMDDALKGVFKSGDKFQRSVVDKIFDSMTGTEENEEETRTQPPYTTNQVVAEVNSGKLDTTTFVVIGEGLAAGFVDFGLHQTFQEVCFAAQMAGQMQTRFEQPLIQAPGIGHTTGFRRLPVVLPANFQTTIRDNVHEIALCNLSVPGFTLSDALNTRPVLPVIHRENHKQTSANLILGLESFVTGNSNSRLTQFELAQNRTPSFVLIALGFHEVLEAIVGDADWPDEKVFGAHYEKILAAFRTQGSEVLSMTIPDPLDTAYLSDMDSAAKILKVEPSVIRNGFGLAADDVITVEGLMEMGCQLLSGDLVPLPEGAVLKGNVVGRIRECVSALNQTITALAEVHGALVYDLHNFYHSVKTMGVTVGDRTLTAEFLGGFYSLNGYYPGPTGHALIANDVLQLLNNVYGATFSSVDVGEVMETDPVADYKQAEGPFLAMYDLTGAEAQTPPPPSPEVIPDEPVVEGVNDLYDEQSTMLKLPPGREQVLQLNKEASYFGDAIRPVNCKNKNDADFGSSGELFFGGLAMTDSHLDGYLRFRFSEPKDDVTHFEVFHGGETGLVGDDGILTAPTFFKLPVRYNQVKDDPELVSSGDLNLETGEVTNLDWAVRFFNTALFSLVRVNPQFPDVPIQFPGMYGSAWADFKQRDDGKLDFNFYGTTFVPLGMVPGLDDPIRFPLPFCSPTQQYASIPARGTSLHPHLHLSTAAPESLEDENLLPEFPENTIQEYTLYTRNTSFGDLFTLDLPELGGTGKGRSHLLGRIMVQFGQRCGDSVPIGVTTLNPGGFLGHALKDNPLSEQLPGSEANMPLLPGPHGHSEFLRFPQQTYFLNNVFSIDDPFDLSVGMVNLKTGKVINKILQRGLISQNLFFALIRVEPRTPKSSFYFRGPACFENGARGETVFRFDGEVRVVYPGDFLFPSPNMGSGFKVLSDSTLDPFMWLQATHSDHPTDFVKKGKAEDVVASTGEHFSYQFEIPVDPEKDQGVFDYTNHSQDGTFKLHSLTWVDFSNSRESKLKEGNYDTVSFSGYGRWKKAGQESIQLVSAQISTAPKAPYVSIQINGGFVSNVNTKPTNENSVRP
jgi:hypothetical protein